jgi:hypothetical protein
MKNYIFDILFSPVQPIQSDNRGCFSFELLPKIAGTSDLSVCNGIRIDFRLVIESDLYRENSNIFRFFYFFKKARFFLLLKKICLAVCSVQFKSNLVLECRKLLMNLAEINSITLIWVPGHTNVQSSERADELAREGSAMDFVGPEPAL